MMNSWAAPNNQDFLMNPSELAGFESTAAFSPVNNMIYVTSHNVPAIGSYVAVNSSNYATTSGINVKGGFLAYPDNATVEAINGATGQMVWSHNIPVIGFRGGLMTSGNVVFAPLVSGDVLMLNAQTGAVIKDLFIGAPMDVVPSIGATASGTEEIILTVGSASFFGPSTAGDIVALQLQNLGSANTVTTTATTTATTTTTTTVGAGQTVTTNLHNHSRRINNHNHGRRRADHHNHSRRINNHNHGRRRADRNNHNHSRRINSHVHRRRWWSQLNHTLRSRGSRRDLHHRNGLSCHERQEARLLAFQD